MIFKHSPKFKEKEEKANNTSKIYQCFVPQVNNLRDFKQLEDSSLPRTMHCI